MCYNAIINLLGRSNNGTILYEDRSIIYDI